MEVVHISTSSAMALEPQHWPYEAEVDGWGLVRRGSHRLLYNRSHTSTSRQTGIIAPVMLCRGVNAAEAFLI